MELVLASGNAGKLGELTALLRGLDLVVRPQSDFALPPVAETATTFAKDAAAGRRQLTGATAQESDST